VSLDYRVDGPETGPALVLSNSIGTTTELWKGQIHALAQTFRVVRYDHPGHGGSPDPEGPVTVESLARSVVELLDRLELERASFCGLSLGGMVGMALALNAPDRVDRLVLCCTSAYLGPPEGWHERARIVRSQGMSAIAERIAGRWFSDRFRETSPETVTYFLSMLAEIRADGYAACCEAIAAWDARAVLGAIRAPTLVIAGAEDVATPPAEAASLAGSIPGAELTVLPDAAHLANVEQPEHFTQALLGHLAASSSSEEAA
jgi:3-oxoadipate enol-lactonase